MPQFLSIGEQLVKKRVIQEPFICQYGGLKMAKQIIPAPQGEESNSKLDLITGRHTKDIIVGVLALFILITVNFGKGSEAVNNRLMDGFLILVGVFAGSKIKP